ncbi:hypothetical protein HX799_07535 [Pseudomonas tolaasii]|uniref:hypothetical protein n=1 Tax=Pseudomonas tolaasii TaxID=29442 RepID=UPI0015A30B3A|nr:hypothetical protein [Pseudomonas tolaasii]NWC26859.1 hypothetical protein [Pseudomonas tolaasii]NWC51012.1 hypothetical protein [Pseudomonas tolaasii]NWE62608.1 hypothetical protein [Pseudomonas tolaasii]
MTLDKQKLQKLLWSEVASWKADCLEWKQNAEALGEFLGDKTVEEVALELLAENERLKTLRSTTERDLAQELEVWKLGPSCWSCGDTGDVHDMVGEWRGQCDCNAAKLIDAASEREQLKAENEQLKSDCRRLRSDITAWRLTVDAERQSRDAYKSELERLTGPAFAEELTALRKDAERYQWLRMADWWQSPICAIQNPKEQAKLGSDCPSGERLDEAVDAAMGKGGQS